MRMPVLALVAFGALGVATTLPAAVGSSPVPRTTATLAEARLIDRLREMAQPPDTTPDLPLRPRIEVAMATPAAAVQTRPRPLRRSSSFPELNIRLSPTGTPPSLAGCRSMRDCGGRRCATTQRCGLRPASKAGPTANSPPPPTAAAPPAIWTESPELSGLSPRPRLPGPAGPAGP